MIEKRTVCQIVEEWLEDKDYFLVEVTVSPDDKIVVEIDHAEGVWIEDCVELSRFIESKLNREEEDYEELSTFQSTIENIIVIIFFSTPKQFG